MGLAAVTWLYFCGWNLEKWLRLQAEWGPRSPARPVESFRFSSDPTAPSPAAPVPVDASRNRMGLELCPASLTIANYGDLWSQNY